MKILVKRSQRHRQWGGVALFAFLVAGLLWWGRRDETPLPPPAPIEHGTTDTSPRPFSSVDVSGAVDAAAGSQPAVLLPLPSLPASEPLLDLHTADPNASAVH